MLQYHTVHLKSLFVLLLTVYGETDWLNVLEKA